MSKLDKSTYRHPENINEKWWFTKILDMIEKAQYGSLELEITINNKQVVTIKEHTRKSHSYNND